MSQGTLFDKTAFRKYVKYIGRAYRKQATELVSICRAFVQAQEQTPASDARLTAVLELVDDALKSATEAETKKSKVADEKFSKAIELLKKYDDDYHRSYPSVEERMKKAKADDKSSSTFLHRLMEKDTPIEPEDTKVVEFLLQKSLPEARPAIVRQELCKTSGLNEVLWNFSRFKDEDKRLTLKQNPHFYTPLPRSSGQYGGKYKSDPIYNFQHDTISVLTDGLGRVHMEVAKTRRTFGGVWVANNAIIFKDICGKLEGDCIVGGSMQNTDLSCFDVDSEGSLHSPTSLPATQDWREPILTMLKSKDFNRKIHITDKPPASGSPGSSSALRSGPRSVRRSPIPGTGSGSQNSKQYTSPPTTSTTVLPSSNASSRPHAAHTATPPSSVPPQPRTSPASSPRAAPTAATAAPPPSVPSQPRTSSASSPLPVPTTATAAPSSSVPSQPRTSSASSPRLAPTAATAAPPSSVPSQPRTSHASSPRPAPTTATAASPSSAPSQPRTSPASAPRPAPTAATAAPPSSVPQTRTSSASPSRPAHAAAPPSSTVSTIPHHPSPQSPPTSTSRVTGVATSIPSPRVGDPETMAPSRASPPLPVLTQAINSQPKPQPVSRKKNWFQSHVWDYGNK